MAQRGRPPKNPVPQTKEQETTVTAEVTSVGKMSLVQLQKEVRKLRAENTGLKNRTQQLELLCERFAEQYKNCDKAYEDLRHIMGEREAFMKQVVNTAAASINRMEVARV